LLGFYFSASLLTSLRPVIAPITDISGGRRTLWIPPPLIGAIGDKHPVQAEWSFTERTAVNGDQFNSTSTGMVVSHTLIFSHARVPPRPVHRGGPGNLGLSGVTTFMVSMPILIVAWFYLVGWLIDRSVHKWDTASGV
jgi:hypothetical protein